MSTIKLLTICFTLIFIPFLSAEKKVVCYWFSDVVSASQINPTMCTHIVYSFIEIDSSGRLNYGDRTESEVKGKLRQLVALKSKNSNLKFFAAVGGGEKKSLLPEWSSLAANPVARINFANNVKTFLVANNLHGIDIDWECPNDDEKSPQDKDNFILLLNDLKQTLGSRFSLSIALSASEWRVGLSYIVDRIFEICDFVNVMTYDFHGGWESKTGLHGAMYRRDSDDIANVDTFVKFLLAKGAKKSKLVVGIPTYGIAFVLNNPTNNGVGAPAQIGEALKFSEICKRINARSLTSVWDATQKVPYAFRGSYWIGYDNVQSVTIKANYIRRMNLGGAMFWSIDGDDFSNKCGFGNYPLISTVSKIVKP